MSTTTSGGMVAIVTRVRDSHPSSDIPSRILRNHFDLIRRGTAGPIDKYMPVFRKYLDAAVVFAHAEGFRDGSLCGEDMMRDPTIFKSLCDHRLCPEVPIEDTMPNVHATEDASEVIYRLLIRYVGEKRFTDAWAVKFASLVNKLTGNQFNAGLRYAMSSEVDMIDSSDDPKH